MINISLTYKKGSITLPINPEEFEISSSNDNKSVNIVGLGEIIVPGETGLATCAIDSFFWAAMDDVSPRERIIFIKTMQASKAPIRLVVEGLNVDMQVLIQQFNYNSKAGEEDDVYYSLQFKEFRAYGAETIDLKPTTQAGTWTADPPAPQRTDNKPSTPQVYAVTSGDTLWGIAKRLSTQGGANWRELYEMPENKAAIGNNPDILQIGQQLVIPESWLR